MKLRPDSVTIVRTQTLRGRRWLLFSDGSWMPVVSGGDGPTDPPAPPPPPAPAPGPARTFTQEEVSRLLAAEKDQGRRSAATELLQTLGVEKPEDAKAILDAHREAERGRLTEAQRAEQDAKTKAEKAAADAEAAANDRRAAAVERALLRAGLRLPEKDDEAETVLSDAVRLVNFSGDPTPEAVKSAVEAVKGRFGALFGPAAPAPPNADPPGRQPPRPGGGATGIEAGRARAQAEREERQKQTNGLGRMTVVGSN